MIYPDYNTYSKLYGRYLTKSIDDFFIQCDPKGKAMLDLCAGGGRLSQYALDHGADRVVMVDMAPQMLSPDFNGRGRAVQIEGNIEDYVGNFQQGSPYEIISTTQRGMMDCYRGGSPDEKPFDIVTCRQGMNYWFKNVNGKALSQLLVPGGMLVFNTFGNKPSTTPTVREYYHDGLAYKEISYLIGDRVHHVQTATGISPHMTEFDWIDRGEIMMKLNPYFTLKEIINGPSSMWYCYKL